AMAMARLLSFRWFRQPELDGPSPRPGARNVLPDDEPDAIPPQRHDLPAELLLVEAQVVPETIRRLHERSHRLRVLDVPDDAHELQAGDFWGFCLLDLWLLPRLGLSHQGLERIPWAARGGRRRAGCRRRGSGRG